MMVRSAPIAPHDSQILDLAHDGIFLLGLDGTIVFWNRGAEEMYGWSREDAIGKTSHDLLRTRFPYPLERIMQQMEDSGQWSGELIHTTRDGRELMVSARWALERDAGGRPSGFLEI